MNASPKPDQQLDLIVIGSGSAGTSAAKVARAKGRTVAMIEKDQLGGDCPNYACVPTKALLRSARLYSLLKRAAEFGLRPGKVDFDWGAVLARKDAIVHQMGGPAAEKGFRKNGITLFRGQAAFEDQTHIRVDGQMLQGERIMIASGSKPELPDIPGVDEVQPITSVQAVSLLKLPHTLVILGGGPVGCEFAQLFSTFGVQVTLLQKHKTLLPHEEPELSELIQRYLEESGVKVLTNAEVKQFARDGSGKQVYAVVEGRDRQISAEEILMATGRDPQTAELNLAAAGVELEKGNVRVNDYLQTSRSHIYAGGDVSGPFQYTHFAHYQGRLAGSNMFSEEPRKADYRVVPRVTFTDPCVAGVGMTEEQARQEGHRVTCATIEIKSLGKAVVESEEKGLVKIVADAGNGEILGGHIVGAEAGEMIHEVVAAMAAGATVRDLAEAIHAFPNFAEGVKAAARKWLEATQG